MAVADIQTSFAAGELSPQLYARVDLDKYQVGAALLRNFFVDYRGGISNRAGTEYIFTSSVTIGHPPRLIPFIVSTDAAYVLMFEDMTIKIFNRGTFVTEVATPYAVADLFDIAYTQSADVLTLVHPSYPPADLSRTSDTTFVYAPITIGPDIGAPTITALRAPHSQDYMYGYLITAVDADGKEESLPSNPATRLSLVMNEAANAVIGIQWDAPSEPVSRYNVYKWGPVDLATLVAQTTWGFIGTAVATSFTDNNIAPDFSKQPPGWGDPFSGGQIASITVTSGGGSYSTTGQFPNIPYVPLTIVGDGTDAAGYAVIDNATHQVVGVFLTNPGKNYTTATVTAVGQGGSTATFDVTFTDPAPLYPAATAYLQQRRVFGGSNLKPETLVMSQPGLINNFNTTPVVLATDAIVLSIAAEEVNTIKSFVQVNYGLLAFTTGGSFLVNGGSPGAPIDANSPSVQPQVSQGANSLRPIRINYDVIYGQAKGNRIHNLAFAWQKQSYAGKDISTLAAHLFDTFRTVDWTYAEEPFKIVWAVRDDGRLLSLTYVPEEEVYAWCRHDTQGLFKSVCSVPEGNVDAVYFIVERHVPNEVGDPCWVYFLERMHERQGCCIFDAWFLDAATGLTHISPPTPLYLEGDAGTVGSLVVGTAYDVCSNSGPYIYPSFNTYRLQAVETVTSAMKAQLRAAFLANDPTLIPQFFGPVENFDFAYGYDPVRRKIMYSMGLVDWNNYPTTNTTGFNLWNGSTEILSGDTYNSWDENNYITMELDIDTGVVTAYPSLNTTNLTPSGVGGVPAGCARYMDAGAWFYTGPRMLDPRTGNVLVHTNGNDVACSVYFLERAANYQLKISPFGVLGEFHYVLSGGTNNYWYIATKTKMYLTPRTALAAEIAVDYKSQYANFNIPLDYSSSRYRICFDQAGNHYMVGTAVAGARNYKLWKFVEPTSTVIGGGGTVGGGYTEITPWTNTTGPNTGLGSYSRDSTFAMDTAQGGTAIVNMYLPATNELAIITKNFPGDFNPFTQDPLKLRFDCTYVGLAGVTFDFHSGFITGFMKADWTPAANAGEAAWVVRDLMEINPNLNVNSYDYRTCTPPLDYVRRQFFAVVVPVVDGVYPAFDNASVNDINQGDNHTLILTYDFISGAPPALISVKDESLWGPNYPTLGEAPIRSLLNDTWHDSSGDAICFLAMGIWDELTKAWYFRGYRGMPDLDASYVDRWWAEDNTEDGPTVENSMAAQPILKIIPGDTGIGGGIQIGDIVQNKCGKLEVTHIFDTNKFSGIVIAPFELELPDDPDGLLIPIDTGDWTVVTPVRFVSGLDYINGKSVTALADGVVVNGLTVTPGYGVVDLGFAASSIVVGLSYTQQAQTLYLTTEGIQQGSDQGKRKQISGITLRVDCSRGVKAGSDYGSFLTPIPELNNGTSLYTGDCRVLAYPNWDERGFTVIQQDDPLPATILGVIVEVTPGDTGS